MLDEIQEYTNSVKNGTFACRLDVCPRCGGQPTKFSCHDRRARTFLVIVDRLVHKIRSLITRWKCPLCKHTFTVYPSFALRNKRYVCQTVLDIGIRYLTDRREQGRSQRTPEKPVTYREAVTVNCMPVFHQTSHKENDNAGEEPALNHSTPHRWLTSLAKLPQTLLKALGLIKEKDSTSSIFREVCPIHPQKYRSEKRRSELQTCLHLFRAAAEFLRLFDFSIFPHFATRCGWT